MMAQEQHAQRTIYCISGLGADERVFSRLVVPGAGFVYLQWLIPAAQESITDYATRMCGQIPAISGGRVVLMGVSFGGMMAIEMAKQIPGAAVILISSVKSRKELPWSTRLAGRLGLYSLIPTRPGTYSFMRPMRNYFLGVGTREEASLSNEFSENVDPVYLRWAVRQIVCWKNEWQPPVLYHIHGSKDRAFPIGRIAATHVVEGGGHFMVMNRAKEISGILAGILSNIFGRPATNDR
jgi:pimeloyl-ACP methyl ester carboxylesterase